MTDLTLSVPDVHCDHCKDSIEGAVGALAGVDQVAVQIDERTVRLSYDPGALDLAAVVEAIEGQGYEVAGTD